MPISIARILLSILLGALGLGTLALQANQKGRVPSLMSQPAIIRAKSKLLKGDRERVAQARAEGKTEVMLVIASVPGANARLANQVSSIGGKVRYRDDQVDYLRATVPTGMVETLARSKNIQALSVGGTTFYNTSHDRGSTEVAVVGEGNRSQTKINPPDRNTPAVNPYIPTRDIGAPQFVAKHPSFDGRGVTIAFLDLGNPDLLCPELQEATTLDGKPVRKLIDVLDAYDSDEVNHLYYLTKIADEVVAKNGQFTHQGIVYAAPADGHYLFGFFDERAQRSPLGGVGDVNLDGNPPGSRGLFNVLWNTDANYVWVDTNQNRSFADEKALTDYSVKYDAGTFSSNKPETAARVTFMIKADVRNKSLRLFPVLAAHATAVMSLAAGRGFFGGNINGVAPGAQVISVLYSYTNHGVIEAMILAMKHPKVDIVNASIGSLERQSDGNSTVSVIWDRLVERYDKPIFISADNRGPGVSTMSEIAFGNKVMSVGAYIHKDTLLVNQNLAADKDDYVVGLSSHGPRLDGGFKPDVLAPAASVVARIPSKRTSQRIYELPPGYTKSVATSFAAPMAAGAAALLISAAKQTGMQYDVDRLRWAMKSSARYLPGYAANDQGDGLLNVEAAWEALQKTTSPLVIKSRASANHILSKYLKDPDRGTGIYEREGWTAGETAERRIYFTRTSGQAKVALYTARWVGNDGTFKSQETIKLPLNTPISFPVTVGPKTQGIHSAILRLIDPSDSRVVFEVMNTVIAAQQFSARNGFTVSGEGQLDYRPGYKSYFFNVPRNTAALKFDLSVAKGSLRARFLDPAGVEFGLHTPPYSGWSPYQGVSGTQTRTITRPESGVWEVVIEDDDYIWDLTGGISQEKGKFTFCAAVFGVDVQPSVLEIDSPQERGSAVLEVNFVNRMAAFLGSINNTALGSAFDDRPTLVESGEPQIYEIDVPPGAESLRAQIKGATDRNADLDLYLYDGTDKGCGGLEQVLHNCKPGGFELKAFSIGPGAEEVVEVVNPNPGKWKVVIDPVSVPSGKTTCGYADLFTHRPLGEIRSDGKAAERVTGAKWKGNAEVRVEATPGGRRYLAAVIEVATEKAEAVSYTMDKGRLKPVERRVILGEAIGEVPARKRDSSLKTRHGQRSMPVDNRLLAAPIYNSRASNQDTPPG